MTDPRRLAEQYLDLLEARDWSGWTALLAADVVYELPQSHERVRGRERLLRFNQEYPGEWHLRRRMVLADEEGASIWADTWIGAEHADLIVFLTLAGGLITRVTDYWPEPFEPPPGREHLVERYEA